MKHSSPNMFAPILSFFGLNCGCFLLIIIFNLTVGALATQYTLNTWVPLWKPGWSVELFPWCFVIGLFLGEIAVPVAVITYVLTIISVI